MCEVIIEAVFSVQEEALQLRLGCSSKWVLAT